MYDLYEPLFVSLMTTIWMIIAFCVTFGHLPDELVQEFTLS